MSYRATRRRMIGHLMAPAAMVLLGACATKGAGADRELIQRAQEYWALMKANDRLGAWKYEAASKDQSLTLEGYFKRGGIVYEAVEVRGTLRLDGDDAEIDVWMRHAVPQLRIKGYEANVRDRWRLIEGGWYHVLPHNPLFNTAK